MENISHLFNLPTTPEQGDIYVIEHKTSDGTSLYSINVKGEFLHLHTTYDIDEVPSLIRETRHDLMMRDFS